MNGLNTNLRSTVATMMPPRSACLVTVRTYAERERFLARRQQLEQLHAAQVSAGLALSAARERGLRVERDRQDAQEAEREVTRLVRRNGPRHPPPPLPEPGQQDDQPPPAPTPTPAPQTTPSTTSTSSTTSSTVTTTWSATVSTTAALSPPLSTAPSPAKPAVATFNGITAAAINHFQARLKPVPPKCDASQQPRLVNQQQVNLEQQQQQQPQPQQQQQQQRPRSPAPSPTPPPAPPYCPTPDYDSDSSCATTATPAAPKTSAAAGSASTTRVTLNGPEVEMQSLDSMELLEPRAREPRPPQTYFQQSKSAPRPSVCVTIREYGGSSARQPSKLTFLGAAAEAAGPPRDQPAASLLQSELANTLSRSNLRSRTDKEAVSGPVNGSVNGAVNGAVNGVTNGVVNGGVKENGDSRRISDCSTSSSASSHGGVTVTSLNGTSPSVVGTRASPPNGILKKVAPAHSAQHASNGVTVAHAQGVQGIGSVAMSAAGLAAARANKAAGIPAKTITFGAKATIINEKSVAS